MKAINLVPRESRRGTGTLSGLGIGTTAIFAVLGLGLALSVAYVILANGVTSRQDQLAKLNQQSNATVAEVNSLKPYADLEGLRESLLDRVRSLADGRYDWPTTLSRIARALPSDTTLTSFDGGGSGSSSSSAPAATAGAAPAGTTPSSGPTVTLSGCTPSHQAVAGVIDRLRSVDGVAAVSLQSSTISASSDAASGSSCPGAEQFKLTVQMAAPAAPATPATGAPAGTTAAPGTTTTTPSTPSPAGASTPTASTGTAPGGTS